MIGRRGVTGGQTSYLGPFGVDDTCFDCVIQSRAVLAQSEIRRRAVAVQDAVLGVGGERLAVEMHGEGVLPLLARLVTAANALQELGLAQAGGAGARRSVHPLHRWG